MSLAKASEGIKIKGRSKSLRTRALRASWLKSHIKSQKNKCAICGGMMAPSHKEPHPFGMLPSLDHIKPLSKGGLDHWENTQATHSKCNQEKGADYDE